MMRIIRAESQLQSGAVADVPKQFQLGAPVATQPSRGDTFVTGRFSGSVLENYQVVVAASGTKLLLNHKQSRVG